MNIKRLARCISISLGLADESEHVHEAYDQAVELGRFANERFEATMICLAAVRA